MDIVDALLELFRGPVAPDVLVTGMPKSGTTAILELMGLAAGRSTVNDPFYRLDQRGVVFREAVFSGQLSVGELIDRHRPRFRGDLVKDPNFAFLAPALHARFPDARWVFTIRDPRDNIRSILNRLSLSGRPEALATLPEGLSATWRNVLEGRHPAVPGRDVIERLAQRWNLMAAAMAALPTDRVVFSRYEDFMRAKEPHIVRMCQEVGLDPVHAIGRHVDTQFQRKGDRQAVWSDFFGAEALAQIETVCAEGMQVHGYAAGASAAPRPSA